MTASIKHLDDVSLEKVMRNCSDQTVAHLLIHLNPFDCARVMNLLSKAHKIAIQAELIFLEKNDNFEENLCAKDTNSSESDSLSATREFIETGVEIFWERVRLLEAQGEIIVSDRNFYL